MNILERIEELMDMGWTEEQASREAYAELYPERYEPEDYEPRCYEPEDYDPEEVYSDYNDINMDR